MFVESGRTVSVSYYVGVYFCVGKIQRSWVLDCHVPVLRLSICWIRFSFKNLLFKKNSLIENVGIALIP